MGNMAILVRSHSSRAVARHSGLSSNACLSSPRAATTLCQPSGIDMNIIDESQLRRMSTVRGESCGYIVTPSSASSLARSIHRCVRCGAESTYVNPVHVIGMPRLPQRWPRSRSVSIAVGPSRSGTTSTTPRPAASSTSNSASNSAPSAIAGRHRSTRLVDVEERRGETPRALVHRGAEHRGHRRGLVVGRGARPRVGAHRDQPEHAVPDQAGEVDAGARRVDHVAVAGVVGPRPRHRVVEEMARDVLDVGEEVGDVAAGRVGDGVEREAAVADQHRGHAVQQVGVDVRIPEHLRVGVAVGVDEPGRHHRAGGVDHRRAVDGEVGADLDDLVAADAHVGTTGGCAGAVDDVAAPDQDLAVDHAVVLHRSCGADDRSSVRTRVRTWWRAAPSSASEGLAVVGAQRRRRRRRCRATARGAIDWPATCSDSSRPSSGSNSTSSTRTELVTTIGQRSLADASSPSPSATRCSNGPSVSRTAPASCTITASAPNEPTRSHGYESSGALRTADVERHDTCAARIDGEPGGLSQLLGVARSPRRDARGPHGDWSSRATLLLGLLLRLLLVLLVQLRTEVLDRGTETREVVANERVDLVRHDQRVARDRHLLGERDVTARVGCRRCRLRPRNPPPTRRDRGRR